jgi:hypothetical protein
MKRHPVEEQEWNAGIRHDEPHKERINISACMPKEKERRDSPQQ